MLQRRRCYWWMARKQKLWKRKYQKIGETWRQTERQPDIHTHTHTHDSCIYIHTHTDIQIHTVTGIFVGDILCCIFLCMINICMTCVVCTVSVTCVWCVWLVWCVCYVYGLCGVCDMCMMCMSCVVCMVFLTCIVCMMCTLCISGLWLCISCCCYMELALWCHGTCSSQQPK